MLQVFEGGAVVQLSDEGGEKIHGDRQRHDKIDADRKEGPVAGVGLGGHGHEAHRAGSRCEQTHTGGPPGDLVPSAEKVVRTLGLLAEMEADVDQYEEVKSNDTAVGWLPSPLHFFLHKIQSESDKGDEYDLCHQSQ